MKLDILAIGAHPDDVELSCSGTLLRHIKKGYKVGLLDLTRGELGSRGNADIREKEAEASKLKMGALQRVNLNLGDGFFSEDEKSILKIIEYIREWRPNIVLANALKDRHPDHGRAASLVARACFLSGLRKIESKSPMSNEQQEHWRPNALYHYIQDEQIEADFVVDISEFISHKMECILCFGSQFHNPANLEFQNEASTPISGEDFMDFLYAKGRVFGRPINVDYAEGFNFSRVVGVGDLNDLQ